MPQRPFLALVGNGSVVVMASGCVISECYESSNIVSTNQGPLLSGNGALKFAIEELGPQHAACTGFIFRAPGKTNIPSAMPNA